MAREVLPSHTYKVLRVEVPRDGKPPLVAQWGGIPLERDMTARLKDDNILERRWNAAMSW